MALLRIKGLNRFSFIASKFSLGINNYGLVFCYTQKKPFPGVLRYECSKKFHKIHRKTYVRRSLITKIADLHPATLSNTSVFPGILQIFKKNLIWFWLFYYEQQLQFYLRCGLINFYTVSWLNVVLISRQ